MNKLRKYFITGLIVLMPIAATIYLLALMLRFFDNISGRFINNYLKNEFGFFIPGIGLIISILIVLLAGFLASWFIGKKILRYFEKRFEKLPLVKNIYPAFKQLALFLLVQKELGLKRVVLVEYPSKGIWSVGFLTNESLPKINKAFNREMVPVFVPSSPGPLTGYVIFVDINGLKFPDISVSDALKIIISGGVLSI